ncbi:N-acetylneuraminate synthase [Oleidesulfovibrio alaskensis G20]|uniref:N-acetylneuraminate synthase n=1 Tax=Oleidesulfovibrio alaskensis (strain ATCC BAA-1058 / DSM 17464 / G20) TaxID=207559 RepID=Q30V22_OLEA2|nr:N-acetylneuraminate synthase family protein [Oleidesulfovibrio alaskensis]ABB40474.1 N-acetylneuraminate synthase [Oleidesulfovibrio alaskensis G20]MBG0772728.1 N-acetylneuraminate synthase family protein [Oleidesulfovibrio alaskensis]MBL3583184.1 N-acetylneuraminate synthase family protein [Oleidesulfovibrio alaskensis]
MSYFISDKNPVFVIAEIGGNHEGDFAYARKLVSLAIESGADAVKLQVYAGDALVSRVESPDRNRHFKKFELSRGQYEALIDMCRHAGVQFMASAWDRERLGWIEPHVRIHKAGSGDLTAYPMLRALVSTGKPLVLSTGLSTMPEVEAAVRYIGSLDSSYITQGKLALLQCSSAYPCPDGDANLNVMHSLRQAFGLPVGYSDHTTDSEAAYAAAVMGAQILELHFTDTREGKSFRDHLVSITRDELRDLLKRIRRARTLQGSWVKQPTDTEKAQGHVTSFRRSVYAAQDIAAGQLFTEDNLTVLRPAHGVCATRYEDFLGRRAPRSMGAHEVLTAADLQAVLEQE